MVRNLLVLSLLLINIQTFSQETKYVNADILNVREKATSQSEVINKIKRGQKIKVFSSEGKWSKVILDNGETGYVSSDFLSDSNKTVKSKIKDSIILYILFGVIFISILYRKVKSFGRNSPSKFPRSANKTLEHNLKWYHCGLCNTVIKKDKNPANSNFSCQNKTWHKWEEIGTVGNTNFQCQRCGTTIQSTDKPRNNTNWSCLGSNYHKWSKL